MTRLVAQLRRAWAWLVAEVKAARAGEAPGTTILVPRAMGPLVVGRDAPNPVPLNRVPVRSSKADLRRIMHRMAELHAHRRMSWGEAQRYLQKLRRTNPDLELPMPTEAQLRSR